MAKLTDERDDLAKHLRRRAIRMDVWATAILLAIVLLLGGGAYVFIDAYQFAQEDLRSEYKRNLQGLKEEEGAANTKLESVYQSITTLAEQYLKDTCDAAIPARFIGGGSITQVRDYAELLRNPSLLRNDNLVILRDMRNVHHLDPKCPDSFARFAQSRDIESLLGEYSFWKDILQKISSSETNVETAMVQKLAGISKNDDATTDRQSQNQQVSPTATQPAVNPWAVLIQTNITRFGTMILLIFLVSILIPLYRYNARLAAFYRARADALRLISESRYQEGFASFATAMTPVIDFGKMPSAPLEQAVTLIKEVMGLKGKADDS